jgi:valyl-tRNA synthetase
VTPATADRWIEGRLAATVASVREHLRRYRFNDAASAIYQFLWHEFADWYLEVAKLSLYRPETPEERLRTQHTLVTVLETTLRLLHPFMPFITEEIWQRLPHEGESIMVAPYPRARRRPADGEAERAMGLVIEVVTAIRAIRGEMRVPPGVAVGVTVRPAPAAVGVFESARRVIEALARVRLAVDPAAARPASSALAVVTGADVYVELAGVIDLAAERQRLEKEIRRADETIATLEGKLARPEFVERAPAEVVERERGRLAAELSVRDKLGASLGWLGDGGS